MTVVRCGGIYSMLLLYFVVYKTCCHDLIALASHEFSLEREKRREFYVFVYPLMACPKSHFFIEIEKTIYG